MLIFKLLWTEVLAAAFKLQTNRTTYRTVFTSDAAQNVQFEPRM
jgi:hypothetical protein